MEEEIVIELQKEDFLTEDELKELSNGKGDDDEW